MSPKSLISFVLVLLITCSVCMAQPPKSKTEDSKKASKLSKYRSAQSSDDFLNEAEKIADKDPGTALDRVEEALAESIAQGNSFNEARSYLLIGDINARISEWKLAAQNYEKSYSILKATGKTSPEFKRALQGLAKSNLETSNFQASIDNYNELLSLPLSDKEKVDYQLAVAEVRYRMGDYDASLKIAQSTPATTQRQNMLAKNFAKKRDFEKSNKIFDSTYSQLRAAPAQGNAATSDLQSTKEEVANSLREQGRYDEEIALRSQSIEYNVDAGNFTEVTKDKIELGKSLEAKGATSAALKELIEAAAIADTINDPHEQANAYLSLANLYEKNGQNNNALGAYRKYSDAVKRSEDQTAQKMEQRSLLITKQTDIEELSKSLYLDRSEENTQKAVIARQQIVIFSLIALMLVVGVTSVFIYRGAQSSKRANQLLALKSLRSQMNPHFIFNALNSVNHFIAQQDERTANKFLSEFSQLMRLVLEYSQEDFITLQKEQEILSLYMKLEHYRFRDRFEYEISIDESINAESIMVPPMLIQPYLENAVWHGLRYRESVGFLKLAMEQKEGFLVVTVSDNGIGRRKSEELKTENQKKHKSTGLKNIKERLAILNSVYKKQYAVNVSDGADGEGTVVQIKFPV